VRTRRRAAVTEARQLALQVVVRFRTSLRFVARPGESKFSSENGARLSGCHCLICKCNVTVKCLQCTLKSAAEHVSNYPLLASFSAVNGAVLGYRSFTMSGAMVIVATDLDTGGTWRFRDNTWGGHRPAHVGQAHAKDESVDLVHVLASAARHDASDAELSNSNFVIVGVLASLRSGAYDCNTAAALVAVNTEPTGPSLMLLTPGLMSEERKGAIDTPLIAAAVATLSRFHPGPLTIRLADCLVFDMYTLVAGDGSPLPNSAPSLPASHGPWNPVPFVGPVSRFPDAAGISCFDHAVLLNATLYLVNFALPRLADAVYFVYEQHRSSGSHGPTGWDGTSCHICLLAQLLDCCSMRLKWTCPSDSIGVSFHLLRAAAQAGSNCMHVDTFYRPHHTTTWLPETWLSLLIAECAILAPEYFSSACGLHACLPVILWPSGDPPRLSSAAHGCCSIVRDPERLDTGISVIDTPHPLTARCAHQSGTAEPAHFAFSGALLVEQRGIGGGIRASVVLTRGAITSLCAFSPQWQGPSKPSYPAKILNRLRLDVFTANSQAGMSGARIFRTCPIATFTTALSGTLLAARDGHRERTARNQVIGLVLRSVLTRVTPKPAREFALLRCMLRTAAGLPANMDVLEPAEWLQLATVAGCEPLTDESESVSDLTLLCRALVAHAASREWCTTSLQPPLSDLRDLDFIGPADWVACLDGSRVTGKPTTSVLVLRQTGVATFAPVLFSRQTRRWCACGPVPSLAELHAALASTVEPGGDPSQWRAEDMPVPLPPELLRDLTAGESGLAALACGLLMYQLPLGTGSVDGGVRPLKFNFRQFRDDLAWLLATSSCLLSMLPSSSELPSAVHWPAVSLATTATGAPTVHRASDRASALWFNSLSEVENGRCGGESGGVHAASRAVGVAHLGEVPGLPSPDSGSATNEAAVTASSMSSSPSTKGKTAGLHERPQHMALTNAIRARFCPDAGRPSVGAAALSGITRPSLGDVVILASSLSQPAASAPKLTTRCSSSASLTAGIARSRFCLSGAPASAFRPVFAPDAPVARSIALPPGSAVVIAADRLRFSFCK